MDSRYLYVEHLTDLTCAVCGETVIPASVSHGFSISHVVAPDGEPVRLAEPPADLRLSARCRAGHAVAFEAPHDVRCMLYRTAPDASSRAVALA
jgi:hypothetical protein